MKPCSTQMCLRTTSPNPTLSGRQWRLPAAKRAPKPRENPDSAEAPGAILAPDFCLLTPCILLL
jgi:hypothetical protein